VRDAQTVALARGDWLVLTDGVDERDGLDEALTLPERGADALALALRVLDVERDQVALTLALDVTLGDALRDSLAVLEREPVGDALAPSDARGLALADTDADGERDAKDALALDERDAVGVVEPERESDGEPETRAVSVVEPLGVLVDDGATGVCDGELDAERERDGEAVADSDAESVHVIVCDTRPFDGDSVAEPVTETRATALGEPLVDTEPLTLTVVDGDFEPSVESVAFAVELAETLTGAETVIVTVALEPLEKDVHTLALGAV
jgi:hypothetical protein